MYITAYTDLRSLHKRDFHIHKQLTMNYIILYMLKIWPWKTN